MAPRRWWHSAEHHRGQPGGLTFNDFMLHLTPLVVIVLIALIAVLPRLFGLTRSKPIEVDVKWRSTRVSHPRP